MFKKIFPMTILVVFIVLPSRSQGTAVALSVVLNQLADRASELVRQGESSGLVLEVQAAGQAVAVISYAQQAYEKDLDLTVNKLSAQQQQFISGIKSLLDDIQNKVFDRIDAISDRVQTIVNILPLTNKFPQLARFSNTYFAPNSPDTLIFDIFGNFFHIANEGNDAYLIIGNKKIKNSTKITTKISFLVPKSYILKDSNKLEYVKGTIEIPYKESCWLVFNCNEKAIFNVTFISLPTRPGRLKYIVSKKVSNRITSKGKSRGFSQHSDQDDKEETHVESMIDGWLCDINSVNYHFTGEEGRKDKDWYDLGNKSSTTAAAWRFKTLHKGSGTSGKLDFYLDYNMYKDILVDNISNDTIQLNWGESKAKTCDAGAIWKIIFDQYDGKIFEFVSSDNSNPYVKLNTAGNSITIRTIP